MSMCSCGIIANSSFSLWSALISSYFFDKNFIGPLYWTSNQKITMLGSLVSSNITIVDNLSWLKYISLLFCMGNPAPTIPVFLIVYLYGDQHFLQQNYCYLVILTLFIMFTLIFKSFIWWFFSHFFSPDFFFSDDGAPANIMYLPEKALVLFSWHRRFTS